MGELSGNCFEIVLRNVRGAAEEEIAATLGSIAQRGFVNYFGLQRFGQGGAGTHEVGVLLLKGHWEAAVRAIMAVRCPPRRMIYQKINLTGNKSDKTLSLRSFPCLSSIYLFYTRCDR
jgi:tRNA pseudouridine13 synthase